MCECARSIVIVACALATSVAAISAVHAAGDDVPALMQRYGCALCHAAQETMAGPSWADVATRYRGDAKAPAKLAKVIRQGEHGGGPWPMPPLPEMTDADARKLARYILATKPRSPASATLVQPLAVASSSSPR